MVENPGGILEDRILHAEISYWKRGTRDHELWTFEEMTYLPAVIATSMGVDPTPYEYLWRMIAKKLEGEAVADRATTINPITWRTISVSEVPQ